MSMDKHIQQAQQRIDRQFPRLDKKLRALLIGFVAEAENAKVIRHSPAYEIILETAAARFLTLLFDESYKPKYQPTRMAY